MVNSLFFILYNENLSKTNGFLEFLNKILVFCVSWLDLILQSLFGVGEKFYFFLQSFYLSVFDFHFGFVKVISDIQSNIIVMVMVMMMLMLCHRFNINHLHPPLSKDFSKATEHISTK